MNSTNETENRLFVTLSVLYIVAKGVAHNKTFSYHSSFDENGSAFALSCPLVDLSLAENLNLAQFMFSIDQKFAAQTLITILVFLALKVPKKKHPLLLNVREKI